MNINGHMKVKTLKNQFFEEFGLSMRVYDGRSFADVDATLASIRKGDNKGGELAPKKNMKVGNLEEKIMDLFGLKTQIAGSDDSYLCDNDLTLSKAKELDVAKMERKEKKVNRSTEGSPLMMSTGASKEDADAPSNCYIPEYGKVIPFKDFVDLVTSFDQITFSTQEMFNIVISDEGGICGGSSKVVILSENEYEPKEEDYVNGDDGEMVYKGQPYSIVFLPNEKVVLLDDEEEYDEFIGFLGAYYAQYSPDVISGKVGWSIYGIVDIEESLNWLVSGVFDIVNEDDEQNENISEFIGSNDDVSLQTACNVHLQVEEGSLTYAGIWYVKSEREINLVNDKAEVSYFDTVESEYSQETITIYEVPDFIHDKLFEEAQQECDSCLSSMAILQEN